MLAALFCPRSGTRENKNETWTRYRSEEDTFTLPRLRLQQEGFQPVYVYICLICIYDAGLPHPPSPPPPPWYPPLPVKWVVVLFGLVAFPSGLVWPRPLSPPPLWSGACGLFGWPRPACGGAVCSTDVWYGCCRLLVVMSSLRALSPPPLWGGACGRFGWPRPACVGSVFYKDMYGMVAAAC